MGLSAFMDFEFMIWIGFFDEFGDFLNLILGGIAAVEDRDVFAVFGLGFL